MPTPTTTEILALRKLDRSADRSWIEWAVAMLVQGHDTPALRILAGEVPTDSPFELWALTDRVVTELGLQPFASQPAAAVALATETARRMLDGELPHRDGLALVAELCEDQDMPGELMDFYDLHYAYEELRSHGTQDYWRGTDTGNICRILDDFCRDWVRRHDTDG